MLNSASYFERQLRQLTDPLNKKNDLAHGLDHVNHVLEQVHMINDVLGLNINPDLLDVVGLCHDIMAHESRQRHHILGAKWVRDNHRLHPLDMLSADDIEACADAIENHRSSSSIKYEEVSLLTRVLRTGDLGPLNLYRRVMRAYVYRRSALNLPPEQAFDGAIEHIDEKFGKMTMSPMWESVYRESSLSGTEDMSSVRDYGWEVFERDYQRHI